VNRWRKRRQQEVRHGTLPFSDFVDSIQSGLVTGGATQFSSLPEVPPRGVRRLMELDGETVPRFNPPGYGGWATPHARPRSSPVVRVGPALARPRPLPSPLQAHLNRASWRAFNRLQARPQDRLCVRRLQRKQVLFARRVAGRRGSAPGPYHRNMWSSWSC